MLRLTKFNATCCGEEVHFLGSAGRGILHAYRNDLSELVILFCNKRVEHSWYHASTKMAVSAWKRCRSITKLPIKYEDFRRQFIDVSDTYKYKNVFQVKGLQEAYVGNKFYVFKESEYVRTIDDEVIPREQAVEIDGKFVNKDKLSEFTFICDVCGERHLRKNLITVHGEGDEVYEMCSKCAGTEAFWCTDCCKYYVISMESEHGGICKNCIANYAVCPRCGRTFRIREGIEVNGEVICDNCHRQYRYKVRGYHDNPELNFLGEGECYIGSEIETEGSSSTYIPRIICTDEFGGHESTLYQMHDGSLGSYGIECITMPMSKKYWDSFGFEEWMTKLKNEGAVASSSCGLHVHLSREWMGASDREEQDLLVGRMCQFLADNKDLVQTYARRTNERWCQYKKSFECKPEQKEERVKLHKSLAKNSDRYTSVNNTNDNTIEFRIFAGTLDPTTYRAAVEFSLRVVDYICTHEEGTETWQEFIMYKPLPQTMLDFMHQRGMTTSYETQQELPLVEQ